jgi:hypothetical protein
MLDCQIYGLKPWGHHLTSVLIHAVNTMFAFWCLQRLTGAMWRSFVVAALFGMHPLRVESVAWVAERKDVLSGLFWFLTLLAYIDYAKKSRTEPRAANKLYALTLACFALGLMAKPMLVTLPFVLLLLDCWPLNRLPNKKFTGLIVEKWPFFVLSVLASVVTFLVQKQDRAVVSLIYLPPLDRIENATVSYVRYLGKLFWPKNLCVYYPRPEHWPLGTVLSAAILLAIILLFLCGRGGGNPICWSAGCGFWEPWCRSSGWCRSGNSPWLTATLTFHKSVCYSVWCGAYTGLPKLGNDNRLFYRRQRVVQSLPV